jgi:ATP-dependent DNA ligase
LNVVPGRDCLWRGDSDLRRLPLCDRRKELEATVPRSRLASLFRVDQYRDRGALFAACAAGELEGVVSKRLDRPYAACTTRDWLKVEFPGWRAANADR